MVWVSRLIDQDVNMFVGARLLATSERNLFASGLLPTRVDAAVYHALALRNEAASVTRERIGDFEYSSPRHRCAPARDPTAADIPTA